MCVAYLTFGLEVPEVADDGELLTLRDGTAHFVIDISKRGASGRAYLGIVQGAALLAQSLLEDAVLQLLHAHVGLLHAFLVLVLLAELLELRLADEDGEQDALERLDAQDAAIMELAEIVGGEE